MFIDKYLQLLYYNNKIGSNAILSSPFFKNIYSVFTPAVDAGVFSFIFESSFFKQSGNLTLTKKSKEEYNEGVIVSTSMLIACFFIYHQTGIG